MVFGVMVGLLGVGVSYGTQNNIFLPFLNTSNFQAPARLDAFNQLQVAQGGGVTLNVSASGVIKAAPGYVASISVISAPSNSVTVYDAASLAGASSVNKVAVLPASLTGVQKIEMPTASGIVVDPGTNGVVAVKFQ